MPEMHVDVRWPDGAHQRWYSPSLVVEEHLAEGASYQVDDFLARSRTALTEASARVEKIYGFPCSRAAASLAALERAGSRFGPGEQVAVTGFTRG